MSYLHDRAKVEGKPFSSSYPPVDQYLWATMENYLGLRKLSFSLARLNGWYPSTQAGDGYARIVIPAFSYQAGNRYWQARAIRRLTPIEPRYQSPHNVSRGDAFVRVMPSVGTNWFPVIGLVIAEGPMDALAAAECGFVGVGLMGATPGTDVLTAVARLRAGMGSPSDSLPGTHMPVAVVADEGALGAATAIWRHFPGARLLTTYPYKDLAEMPLDNRRKLLGN